MWRRLIFLLAPAVAATTVYSQCVAPLCPYGTGLPDGCGSAPTANAYTTRHPDFFTAYAPQSGQNYAAALAYKTFNSPGIDYPVGPNAAQAAGFALPGSASDPTIAANWTAINANAGGAACAPVSGANYVNCSGAFTGLLVIDGFDWSAAGNAGGAAIGLRMNNSAATGSCQLSNNNFAFDPSVYFPTNPIYLYACTSLTVKNNRFFSPWPFSFFAFPGGDPGNGEYITWTVAGATQYLSRYNSFEHCPTRCVGFTAPGIIDIAYDYYDAIKAVATLETNHGDGYIVTTPSGFTISQYNYRYTTWLQPGYVNAIDTTGLLTFLEGIKNVFTANWAANSNVINVTTNSVSIPNGTYFTAQNGAITTPNGWYVVSSVDPINGPFTMNAAITQSSGGTQTLYAYQPSPVTSTDIEGNVIIANKSTANSPSGAGVSTMSYLIEFAYGEYYTVTIKNNFLDSTGAAYCFAGSTPYIDPAPTFSGNYSLPTGAALTGYASTCN